MADATYLSFSGDVQFDIKERTTDNGSLREATIRLFNHPEGRLMQVTLWDNVFEEVEIKKGDTLHVSGKFSSRVVEGDDGNERTFYNVQASSVTVVPVTKVAPKKGEGGERKVSNSKKKSSDEPAF